MTKALLSTEISRLSSGDCTLFKVIWNGLHVRDFRVGLQFLGAVKHMSPSHSHLTCIHVRGHLGFTGGPFLAHGLRMWWNATSFALLFVAETRAQWCLNSYTVK